MSEINTKKQELTSSQPLSAIAKYSDIYQGMVNTMAQNNGLQLTESQKLNVVVASQYIYELCKSSKVDVKELNTSNISSILFNIAMLNLNVRAVPRQCYMILRKDYDDETKKLSYSVDFGIEGDGNDALIRKYGIDVKSLSAPFIVREGDEFTLPYFDGEKMCAPVWKPKNLHGKALYVFYVLIKKDGTKEYPIADRESVATNLKAHILNNLMNCVDDDKKRISKAIANMNLEQLLTNESIRISKSVYKGKEYQKSLISPAYLNPHSQEEMIIRKMRNNCLKKYPKDFESAFSAKAYEETFEDADANKFTPDPLNVIQADYEIKESTEKTKAVIDTDIIDDNGVVIEEKTTPTNTANTANSEVKRPF